MHETQAAEATKAEAPTSTTLVIEAQGRSDYGWVHLPEETIRDARLSLGDIGMLAWLLDRVATHGRVVDHARMAWGRAEADRHLRALYRAGYITMQPDGSLIISDTSEAHQ